MFRLTRSAPYCLEPRRQVQETQRSAGRGRERRSEFARGEELLKGSTGRGGQTIAGYPGGVEPLASTVTESPAYRYTTDTKNRAEGAGVEPARPLSGSAGFRPAPVAIRVALPFASRPGWTRTTALPHVRGTSWPLNDGTNCSFLANE